MPYTKDDAKSDAPKKKLPVFMKKKSAPPAAPSDGAESEEEMEKGEEMMSEHEATCPKCGCEFDPTTGEYTE